MISRTLRAALFGAALLLPSPLLAAPSESAGATTPGALPALPHREVAPRPVHTVKEEASEPARRDLDVRAAPGTAPPPRVAAASPRAPRTPAPATGSLAGAAEPTGAAALKVGGAAVRLFGVRAPEGERCGGRACADRARLLLAERLKRSAAVTCRVPARPGAAICRDRDGVDLGGLLVSEGLARADTAQSYDYVTAEAAARTAHRGLWQSR
jgi:endonuclease YncB( thermonuclease family)